MNSKLEVMKCCKICVVALPIFTTIYIYICFISLSHFAVEFLDYIYIADCDSTVKGNMFTFDKTCLNEEMTPRSDIAVYGLFPYTLLKPISRSTYI